MVDFILFVFVVLVFVAGFASGMLVALKHGSLSAFVASVGERISQMCKKDEK